MNTPIPSSIPTAMLPTAIPAPEHVLLARRLELLADDCRKGRLSETDQMFIRGLLKTLGA